MDTPSGNLAIIGIHGLGKKPRPENYIPTWREALADGLKRNLDFTPATLPFQLVYWGKWFYNEYGADETYAPGAGSGPYPSHADHLISHVIGDVLGRGGSDLDQVKRFVGLEQIGDRLLALLLQDLSRYYDNADEREALRKMLRDPLLEAIRQRQRIMLIAHSMGTIIAYDVLREIGRGDPQATIDHFVTLGSPLGLPHVLGHIHEEWGRVRVPSAVRRWSNFAERRDPIALDAHLDDDYSQSDRGVAVEDALVINSYPGSLDLYRYHKALGYLRAPEFSRMLRDFL